MAAATPTSTKYAVIGNVRAVTATFGTVSDTNTWDSGFVSIYHVSITNTVSGVTYGCTTSGGTITFASSGDLTNPTVMVVGA